MTKRFLTLVTMVVLAVGASGTYAAFANRVTKDMYLYPIPLSQIEVREGLYTQNPGY